MNQLIKAILAFLEANEIVRAEDHEVYAYGLDAILYTMISTLGLVLIGVVMRSTLMVAMCWSKKTPQR